MSRGGTIYANVYSKTGRWGGKMLDLYDVAVNLAWLDEMIIEVQNTDQ